MKRRVSVTVDAELLDRVDLLVEVGVARSRSGFANDGLRLLFEEREREAARRGRIDALAEPDAETDEDSSRT